VWFHVRRVQRLPSLHATHEIPKVQVSRVSRGDALLTVCRAAMLVISSFFFFFYRSLVPSRITPGVCGMFVGRARGDQAEFRRVFSAKDASKKAEIKKRLVLRRNIFFVHGKLGVRNNCE